MFRKKSLEFKVQVVTYFILLVGLFILSLFNNQLLGQNVIVFSSLLVIVFVSAVASGFFIESWVDGFFSGIDEPDYFKKHGEILIPTEKRKLKEKKYFHKTKWFFLIFINIALFIPMSLWWVGIFDDIVFNLSKTTLLLKVLLVFLLSNFLGLFIILKQGIFWFKFLILLSIACALPAVLLVYNNL